VVVTGASGSQGATNALRVVGHRGTLPRFVSDSAGIVVLHSVTDSPRVIVFVPAPLRQYCANASELTVSADSVRQVLGEMERTQPQLYRNVCDETGAIRRHLNVFVNDDNVRDLDGVATKLRREDVVTILPAVSGG
jgi:molybdopterin synthase sulfur carrier subunit